MSRIRFETPKAFFRLAIVTLALLLPGYVLAGACCTTTGCMDLILADCITAGGNYRGDMTACSDFPPPCAGAAR